ncbi:MAG: hypothetical protein NC918_06125 [Candidatus Omnitrophica bacterium]|nr:hypothetical protein [Candidatus Omnitrophota bacterium]
MSSYSNWRKNRIVGGKSESIFVDDFVNFLSLDLMDVRNNHIYRGMDVDFIVNSKKYEIKNNSDNKYILFQEYKDYVNKKLGWFYTSKCDYFVFILSDRKMVILKNDSDFKIYYKNVLKNKKLSKNDFVFMEKSVFFKVPITKLYGFIAIYHRMI